MIDEYIKKKALTRETKTRSKFFKCGKRREIFDLLKEGKTLLEIEKKLGLKSRTIAKVISHPHFQEALEEWLSLKTFDYEMKKHLKKIEAFNHLEKEFEKKLSEASPNVIIRAYLELLSEKNLNPQQVVIHLEEVLMKVIKSKKGPKPTIEQEEKNLETEFGYQPLEDDQEENGSTSTIENTSNPQLVEAKPVED